jgi:GntR family transcriptional regulator
MTKPGEKPGGYVLICPGGTPGFGHRPRIRPTITAGRQKRRASTDPDTSFPVATTEAHLQEKYEVSRNTVREAVKLLVQQRLLVIRAGRGTFVAKIVPFVTTLSIDPRTGLSSGGEGSTYPALVHEQDREAGAWTPEVTVIKCPAHIARLLRIAGADRVVSRHQERYIGGTIWSLQTSYYPREWVAKGADKLLDPEDIPGGAIEYLADIGLRQVGYRNLIAARLPTSKEQHLFHLTHNHTVIEVSRTSFAGDETPIRVTVTLFPADRNQIVYDIGTVPARGDELVRSPCPLFHAIAFRVSAETRDRTGTAAVRPDSSRGRASGRSADLSSR